MITINQAPARNKPSNNLKIWSFSSDNAATEKMQMFKLPGYSSLNSYPILSILFVEKKTCIQKRHSP